MHRRVVLGLGLAVLVSGCMDLDGAGLEDAAGYGSLDSEPAIACATLRLAREADVELLDGAVGLDRRAAAAIVAIREHTWLGTIAALDAVYYVGPKALDRMAEYVDAHAEWHCGEVDVQVLATNDFHGNLKPPSGSSGRIVTGPDAAVNRVDAGGVEFLATHVASLRVQNPNTVVVAAGDIIGASPLISALFHDEPTIEAMNLVGLQIAAVGNHEIDEGPHELLRMQDGGCHPVDGCQDGDDFSGASFSYLAANVRWADSQQTLFPAYRVETFRGARVAFIGMTLEGTPQVVTPSGVAGLEFGDEIETVNALVPELQAQGIEAIVVLVHEGGFATGLYNECAGISGPVFEIASGLDAAVDVVVAGHTNAAHVCELGGKIVTSAASFGRLVTDIDLSIDELTGDVVRKVAQNVIVTRDVPKDAAQTQLIGKYDALAAPIANRVVATVQADLTRAANTAGESTLGAVIADAQLAASSAADKGGSVIAFMNPGGIRTDLLVAQLSGGEQAGEVTYGEVFAVQPFGNSLVSLSVTGAQLDAMLEQQWTTQADGSVKQMILAVSSGFAYRWDAAQPLGSRVGDLTLNGAPIDPAASYRITVNNFLADGGDGFTVLRQGSERVGGEVDVDALEQYLKANAPMAAPALGRITRLN